jgi:hypothetical protein
VNLLLLSLPETSLSVKSAVERISAMLANCVSVPAYVHAYLNRTIDALQDEVVFHELNNAFLSAISEGCNVNSVRVRELRASMTHEDPNVANNMAEEEVAIADGADGREEALEGADMSTDDQLVVAIAAEAETGSMSEAVAEEVIAEVIEAAVMSSSLPSDANMSTADKAAAAAAAAAEEEGESEVKHEDEDKDKEEIAEERNTTTTDGSPPQQTWNLLQLKSLFAMHQSVVDKSFLLKRTEQTIDLLIALNSYIFLEGNWEVASMAFDVLKYMQTQSGAINEEVCNDVLGYSCAAGMRTI